MLFDVSLVGVGYRSILNFLGGAFAYLFHISDKTWHKNFDLAESCRLRFGHKFASTEVLDGACCWIPACRVWMHECQ